MEIKHMQFTSVDALTSYINEHNVKVVEITTEGRFLGNTNVGHNWHLFYTEN